MKSSTAVIAASALLTAVSASPLYVRGNTCGDAPSGSNSNYKPISQPSGCESTADCQVQCDDVSSCLSFIFGLIDGSIQCQLFSVAAVSVPKQSSSDFVVYDKACSSVPTVKPTKSNPTGKSQDSQKQTSSSGQKQTSSSGQKQTSSSSEKQTSSSTGEKQTSSTGEKQTSSSSTGEKQTSSSSTGEKQTGSSSTSQKQTTSSQTQQEAKPYVAAKVYSRKNSANTCGSKPMANTNNQPISQPSVSSADACKEKCKAKSGCKSYTFGTVNNQHICKLYSVAGSDIPAPSNQEQKNAVVAYDVGCSM